MFGTLHSNRLSYFCHYRRASHKLANIIENYSPTHTSPKTRQTKAENFELSFDKFNQGLRVNIFIFSSHLTQIKLKNRPQHAEKFQIMHTKIKYDNLSRGVTGY